MTSDCLLLISLLIWFGQLILIIGMCGLDGLREQAERSTKTSENVRSATKYRRIMWCLDITMILSAVAKLYIDILSRFSEYDIVFWVCAEMLIFALFTAKVFVKLLHLEPYVKKLSDKLEEKFDLSDR